MALSARVTLLFLSVFCAIWPCKAVDADSEADTLLTHRHAFEITMPKGRITGILITKEDSISIAGTMLNEFGVTALSFVYDKHKEKMELQDVMGFLDKWYIRRVLKKDLSFCLHILYGTPFKKNHGYNLSSEAPDISVTNTKRNITYLFMPIKSENETSE